MIGIRAAVLAFLALAARAGATPDLVVDATTLSTSVGVSLQAFAPNACELQPSDRCVAAPGFRKLFKFSVMAVNQGDTDLVLGKPNPDDRIPGTDQPMWVYSQCHLHYHFQTFGRYELRKRGESTAYLTGAKRSFCVEDTKRATSTAMPKYCCTQNPSCPDPTQGVQAGWGDLYPSNLPCQWIDVTDGPSAPGGDPSFGVDVPPGDYDLCVFLNTAGILAEPTANDSTCVPVTIDAPRRPGPHVKIRRPTARTAARVGSPLHVQWKRRTHGKVVGQEVWFSRDGGATWSLVGPTVPVSAKSFAWTPGTDDATGDGRLRVVVWQQFPRDGSDLNAYQRGIGERTLRVQP